MIAWLLRHPWIVAIIALLGVVLYLDQSRASWMRAAIDARMREEAAQFEERLRPQLELAKRLSEQLALKVREVEAQTAALALLQVELQKAKAENVKRAQDVENLKVAQRAIGGRLTAIGKVSTDKLLQVDESATLEEAARTLR